jgi:hypothetical protein
LFDSKYWRTFKAWLEGVNEYLIFLYTATSNVAVLIGNLFSVE